MLNNAQHITMLGIGGIGMSALADFFLSSGIQVSGYDRSPSEITRKLSSKGATIGYTSEDFQPDGADYVVYTPAIKPNDPAYMKAQGLKVPFLKRAEVLGSLSSQFPTVAIAGTHGKTTITSMVSHLLFHSGVPITAFIGGITKNYQSNFLYSGNDWLVVEADEFDRSFMSLSPEWSILSSVDADHLDIYGGEDEVRTAFRDFLGRNKSGNLLLNSSLQSFAQQYSINGLFYGLSGRDIWAENVHFGKFETTFDYVSVNESIKGLKMSFPGEYNLENMLAAIAVSLACGLSQNQIIDGVNTYLGINRRLDFQYISDDCVYVDDYAHHPGELEAVLNSIRTMFSGWNLIAVFQPHLYSRTQDFAAGFGEALSLADEVLLLDIYPAREEPIENVNSEMLLQYIQGPNAIVVEKESLNQILVDRINNKENSKTIVMTLGAGDIDRLVSPFRDCLKQRLHA